MSTAGAGPIEILPVTTKAELDRFIRLPMALHRDDPHYIAPLLMERRQALSPKHNPYFAHAEVAFWLARRAGADVGRISAQIDAQALKVRPERVGHFGLLACIDDAAIAAALTGTAEAWLKTRGMTAVTGPFNLSINEEMGLLIDGFDHPPALLMGHDKPYLAPLLEARGYVKAKDVFAYLSPVSADLSAAIQKRVERPEFRRITLRPLDMKHYDREIATLTGIFNDAWSENWGFVPLTPAEIAHTATALKPLIDPRLVCFAEVDGEPAAFLVCLPNLNEAIRDLGGRLLPFGWLKLLWRLKVRGVKSSRIPLMGVRRKYAKGILGAMMPFMVINAVKKHARKLGIRTVEMSWILEDNVPMNNIIRSVGGIPYKTYRIYRKDLA